MSGSGSCETNSGVAVGGGSVGVGVGVGAGTVVCVGTAVGAAVSLGAEPTEGRLHARADSIRGSNNRRSCISTILGKTDNLYQQEAIFAPEVDAIWISMLGIGKKEEFALVTHREAVAWEEQARGGRPFSKLSR
jgi:hypothetical protein